jgi:DMSO/TMAO reductase YedYZ molybdopterin-dependent catalytic subunit
MLRAPRRRLPARVTNLTLLVALVLAVATGVGAVATGSSRGRWIVLAHGAVAALVVVLAPAKGRIVRAGLRHRRLGRAASLTLAVLTVAAVVAGVLHSTGLVRSLWGLPVLWFHVALALALVPFALWHAVARRVRPRRADLSRRTALRLGWLVAVAAGLDTAVALGTDAARLPGARRRFTGSYETADLPATIWLKDTVPQVDDATWRLQVVDGDGRYELALADLAARGVSRRAVLDCTSGWYSEQEWQGVPVPALIRSRGDARSLLVHSVTGYWVRFPIRDVDRLLLATAVGGSPLAVGNGFPVRLVAPGRRGYWWVKWVDRIELSPEPWWWQPPFPVT